MVGLPWFPSCLRQEAAKEAEEVLTGQVSVNIRESRKADQEKVQKFDPRTRRRVDWSTADPGKWSFPEVAFTGKYRFTPGLEPTVEEIKGPIDEGLQRVRETPALYLGLLFQSSMRTWPREQQSYSLAYRDKDRAEFIVETDPTGAFIWVRVVYQALPDSVALVPDAFTDSMTFQGEALGKPRRPGRGDGTSDVPTINIANDVDPFDVSQGRVGDCWLLSALSALAEFPGAVRTIYKKTADLDSKPADSSNQYIVSLYDLRTWSTVQVTVDERLLTTPSGTRLLGCAPSITGDLWMCYIEKAVAHHVGGWDNIVGGTTTHAWSLLTGSKKQYTFQREESDGLIGCYGAFNPNTGKWEELANNEREGFIGLWPMVWPDVGGGGRIGLKVNQNNLFERMCAWEDANFMMAVGTKPGLDTNTTDGIVDGHAYAILAVVNNVAGTDFDMIKVRNPWGQKGEFTAGRWQDDGPGWQQFPEVEAALKPKQADDGVFWIEKDDFFVYFPTLYLCAEDMSVFAGVH